MCLHNPMFAGLISNCVKIEISISYLESSVSISLLDYAVMIVSGFVSVGEIDALRQ